VEEGLAAAFPRHLHPIVAKLQGLMPAAEHEPVGLVTTSPKLACPDITVEGETVRIPYRVYNPEPADGSVDHVTGKQALVMSCIYSRHHDGFVRHGSLPVMLTSDDPWVVPFIVQLLGEYVVEIAADIERFTREGLARRPGQRHNFAAFLAENACFATLTEYRAISYWSAYYRRQYPTRDRYPALVALGQLVAQV
jgi:hypothetical protein